MASWVKAMTSEVVGAMLFFAAGVCMHLRQSPQMVPGQQMGGVGKCEAMKMGENNKKSVVRERG